jgi:hypothetical protein
MLLLPTGTRILRPGEKTGFTLAIDGPLLPSQTAGQGYMFGWYTGIYLEVFGPNNLPAGNYDIVSTGGGGAPGLAIFTLRLPLGPDNPGTPLISTIGGQANGTLNVPDDTWLSPGQYDLVPPVP